MLPMMPMHVLMMLTEDKQLAKSPGRLVQSTMRQPAQVDKKQLNNCASARGMWDGCCWPSSTGCMLPVHATLL